MQPGQTWRCLLLQFVSGASADRIRGVARYFRVAFPKGRIIPACGVAADAPGACVRLAFWRDRPRPRLWYGWRCGEADASRQLPPRRPQRGYAITRHAGSRWQSRMVRRVRRRRWAAGRPLPLPPRIHGTLRRSSCRIHSSSRQTGGMRALKRGSQPHANDLGRLATVACSSWFLRARAGCASI